MSRRRNRGDEPTLFDLPLDGPVEPGAEIEEVEPVEEIERAEPETGLRSEIGPEPEAEPKPGSAPAQERLQLPLEPALPVPRAPAPREPPHEPVRQPSGTTPDPAGDPAAPLVEPPRPRAGAAALSVRYLAGLADLAVHAALAISLLFGARLLGVRAGLGDWLPVTLFLLVFSFFYTVLPLAFWGQTPGMAWAGVVARASTGESLTFPQTALRWVGGLVTVSLAGLPVLLAAGGRRSFTDRVSDSETVLVD